MFGVSESSDMPIIYYSFWCFTWQWQCRECMNNIRVYLYKILILMAACCMEMISESSYILIHVTANDAG